MPLFRIITVSAAFTLCAAAQTMITEVAGSGVLGPGYTGDNAAATGATLNMPYATATDSSGNVYIADFGNNAVREVSATGIITTIAGTGVAGYSGDGGPATAAQLNGPTAVAVDSSGNVYIADALNDAIRRISGGIIITYAGGAAGSAGDGGLAISAQLNYPSAIALDAAGNLYIADTGNHKIRKVASTIITTVAGTGNLGYNGDGIAATSATLNAPQGVAVDGQGNIYIGDTANQRIREVSGGTISTIAGTGSAGYSGDKGAAVAAQVNNPHGVAVDSSGNVYIADTGNNVIRKISGTLINTIAGTGTPGFNFDSGIATAVELNSPRGVSVDPTGAYAYIADTGNNEVQVVGNSILTGIIPHFASGGTYSTGFYVINKGSTPAPVTLSFYNDAGQAQVLQFTTLTSTAQVSGSILTDTIPANGLAYYETGVPSNPTALDGSVTIQGSPNIVVQGLFRHLAQSGIYYEAGIGSSPGSFTVRMPFDATTFQPTGAQIYTGIAISNLDPVNSATITCTATNSQGTVIPNAVAPPVLNPQGHWAAYNFTALFGQRGTLVCQSTTKIGAVALRFLGNDALSSLPVLTQ